MRIKLDLIQGLRGLMAMIIVLHHITGASKFYLSSSWTYNVFEVGWIGVDFFFVLSGFIMVYIHCNDLILKENVLLFFKKRLVRIYPIYWIIALFTLMVLLFQKKLSLNGDFVYIIKSLLLIKQDFSPFLGVAWSLIFEVFFYIAFGIGICLGLKLMKYVLFGWLILIILFDFFDSQFSKLFVFNNFIIEFLLGCIIGYQFYFNRYKINFRPTLLISIGLVVLILMWIVSLKTSYGAKSAIESRLVYGFSASCIIFGSALLSIKRDMKIPSIFLLIGDSSYVLYLIHPLVLAFGYKFFTPFLENNSFGIFSFGIIIFFIAVCVGILVHIVIEKRVVKYMNTLILKK